MNEDLFFGEELEDFDLLDSESSLYDPEEDELLDGFDENFCNGDTEDFDFEDDDSAEARRRRRKRTGRYGRASGYSRGGSKRSSYKSGSRRSRNIPQPSRRSARPRTANTAKVKKGFERAEKAIRNVDLDSKVQGDILTQAIKTQQRRISRSEYSQAVSKIVDQFKDSYPEYVSDPFIKAALPLAPLLLLKPQKKGKGLESLLVDPRFWGPALAATIAIVKGKKKEAKEISLNWSEYKVKVRGDKAITAIVYDADKKALSPQPNLIYELADESIATYVSGKIAGVDVGETQIKVTAEGTSVFALAKVVVSKASS